MKNRPLLIVILVLLVMLILALLLLQKKQEKHQESIASAEPLITEKPQVTEETQSTENTFPVLPDADLYYGEIREIKTDETGVPSRLILDSEFSGPYIMNLTDRTCYVDSGRAAALSAEDLQAGDRVYVFHSPIAARSMPPQSPAFVVLTNVPMDVSCGMYHEVEKIETSGDGIRITTDNGSRVLGITGDTQITAYSGEAADLAQIKEGAFVVAWYWDQGEPVKGVSRLMLLP